MTRLAIMQPYFFPYIGYWQLIRAVDRFVIYDDVNYIKGGWVNRNRVLVNGEVVYLTVPLDHASPFRRICDTRLAPARPWREKLVRTIELAYRRAPCFDEVYPFVADLVRHETDSLSEYLVHQLRTIAAFLGIRTEFVPSSRAYGNAALAAQARVVDICRREGADTYVNASGGQALYDAGTFRGAGIDLRFIAMRPIPYAQRSAAFVPSLSIIDALMALGAAGIRPHLEAYDLREAA
ncbi:WbqC family protein [Thiobacillus sedimenti]|uniref:WbqC family protein n=1 Tax=Thiobacillus sedimenti TaxID=3110231 RepID=A0ABZ1CHS4_9PROT|nr:WbqC family protein [Thiobacillus sp. SCUT-2]WRS38939.1 WbqC family protein [Thiobacillus sp. SCUT-2]